MNERKTKIIFFLLAIFFSFVARLLPHPPNFAPMGALFLLAGTYLPKRFGLLLPLAVMLGSDSLIGFYNLKVMAAVYGSFVLIGLMGWWLREHRRFLSVLGSALVGACLFFLVTNFAVWAFTPWYSKDAAGLMLAYTLALPFFKNTLMGNFFYSAVFFGLFGLVCQRSLVAAFFQRLRASFALEVNLVRIKKSTTF